MRGKRKLSPGVTPGGISEGLPEIKIEGIVNDATWGTLLWLLSWVSKKVTISALKKQKHIF